MVRLDSIAEPTDQDLIDIEDDCTCGRTEGCLIHDEFDDQDLAELSQVVQKKLQSPETLTSLAQGGFVQALASSSSSPGSGKSPSPMHAVISGLVQSSIAEISQTSPTELAESNSFSASIAPHEG